VTGRQGMLTCETPIVIFFTGASHCIIFLSDSSTRQWFWYVVTNHTKWQSMVLHSCKLDIPSPYHVLKAMEVVRWSGFLCCHWIELRVILGGFMVAHPFYLILDVWNRLVTDLLWICTHFLMGFFSKWRFILWLMYGTDFSQIWLAKSSNVVYGIECTLCGLIYVGETKGSLNKRRSGHRFQINNGGQQLLYKHFNSPDHSILSMKVRIIEKNISPY
jgi:hypothetical protein